MKEVVAFCILLLFIGHINAQVVENPVFDRTDIYTFRVQKVETKNDTTFVHCLYHTDGNSWANISKDTYLESIPDGKRYPILKVQNLPFSPEERIFEDAQDIEVILCFSQIATQKFNIIESEESNAFNIYGIDLTKSYRSSYTSEDIHYYFESYQIREGKKDWSSALDFSQKQLEATNYVEGVRSFASACSMYNMMMVLFPLNDYKRVIELGNKAIDILRTMPQDSTYLDVLARTYGNIGTAYKLLHLPDSAELYMELSLVTRSIKDGVGRLNYDQYLHHLLKTYHDEENYPKALLYGRELASIYEQKYKEDQKYKCVYINSLMELCEFYRAMEKIEEAILEGKKAKELVDTSGCDDYPWLKFGVYNNLASALVSSGNNESIDEGIELLESITTSARNNEFENNRLFLSAKNVLASSYLYFKHDTIKALREYESSLCLIEQSVNNEEIYYQAYSNVLYGLYTIYRWKNDSIAMVYLDKAIDLLKKHSGEESVAYANLLLNRVRYMWPQVRATLKGINSLLLYTSQATEIIKRHLYNSWFYMSKRERETYWDNYQIYFTWLMPTINSILRTPETSSLVYNGTLFYKGTLLLSEKEFKVIIAEENNPSLTALYNDYVRNLSKIENLYTNRNSSVSTIDSLKTIIKAEEFSLCQKVSNINNLHKGTHYTWKDIRDCLSEEEAAIEIVSYRNIRNDNTYYDAYLIGHSSESPKYFPICGENELKECFCPDSIDYVGLSNLIFGNDEFVQELKKYQSLYISPSGLMNSIGIEYLPIDENRCLSDRFNVYRVSSTREVCAKRVRTNYDSAYLFGGLDYESDSQEVTGSKEQLTSISRAVEESIIQRGGFEPLDGSKIEVERIKEEMTKSGIVKSISLYMNADGNEECFKHLSGNHINILHISTHGMSVSPDNSSLNDNSELKFMLSGEDSSIDKETQLLTHSFLVMSGGNMLINRDTTQYMKTDNILTALEISHLDFKDLDLVVLSACQTGLGDVISGEGVFGLQRGFKKAGAKTIVMSLDKVDDEATRILMVEFYRNLMSGKTKLQSLKDAQKHLRQVENGKYDDPKYWASFIMLDGLN